MQCAFGIGDANIAQRLCLAPSLAHNTVMGFHHGVGNGGLPLQGGFCLMLVTVCAPMVLTGDHLMDRLAGLVGIAYATVLFWQRCIRRTCCRWTPPKL